MEGCVHPGCNTVSCIDLSHQQFQKCSLDFVTSFPLRFLAQVLFILGRGFCLRPGDKRSCLDARKCFLCGFLLFYFPYSSATCQHTTQQNQVDTLSSNNFRWPPCHCRGTWPKCTLKRVYFQANKQNSRRNSGYKPLRTNQRRKDCETVEHVAAIERGVDIHTLKKDETLVIFLMQVLEQQVFKSNNCHVSKGSTNFEVIFLIQPGHWLTTAQSDSIKRATNRRPYSHYFVFTICRNNASINTQTNWLTAVFQLILLSIN